MAKEQSAGLNAEGEGRALQGVEGQEQLVLLSCCLALQLWICEGCTPFVIG